MNRENFVALFMWGIQFDPHVGWLSIQPKKADKGSYWTPAIMAFLDRLGTRLGYETDVEIEVPNNKWVDMVWIKTNQSTTDIVFIEHESAWTEGKIKLAIERLESKHLYENKEADLRVLITYSYKGKETKTKEKNERIMNLLQEFVKEKRNVVIVYPLENWSKDKAVDLTKFKIIPEEVNHVSKNDAFKLFERK